MQWQFYFKKFVLIFEHNLGQNYIFFTAILFQYILCDGIDNCAYDANILWDGIRMSSAVSGHKPPV